MTDESGNTNNLLTVPRPTVNKNKGASRVEVGDKENKIFGQAQQVETPQTFLKGALDSRFKSNEAEEQKAKSNDVEERAQSFLGQPASDNETLESSCAQPKYDANQTSAQGQFQEIGIAAMEGKPNTVSEDDDCQRLLGQGITDQEGSRRRKLNGTITSTSSLEFYNESESSNAGIGSFWEMLVQCLHFIYIQLLGRRH